MSKAAAASSSGVDLKSADGSSGGGATPIDVATFIRAQKRLVDEERQTELAEEKQYRNNYSEKDLERAGLCLMRLTVADSSSGLYGRILITFEPAKGGPLKASKFGVRDIVQLIPAGSHVVGGSGGAKVVSDDSKDSKSKPAKSSGSDAKGSDNSDAITGVVYRMKDTSLTVAFDNAPDVDELTRGGTGLISLIKLANEVTYKRYSTALSAVESQVSKNTDAAGLISVLFGHEPPRVLKEIPKWTPFDASLNATQIAAIDFALHARDIALIHGPPGTGKTTTVIELIRQIVGGKSPQRVLACAPSNVAVDNLVDKLGRAGVRVCRMGHPARVMESVLKYSLDSLVRHSENSGLANDIRTEMNGILRNMKKSTNRADQYQYRSALKNLRKDLKDREQKAVQEVIDRAQVIVCTNTVAADKRLDRKADRTAESAANRSGAAAFDVVVIDEAGQALEASCWIPILRGKKVILAGDHMQLPPTIKSHSAAAGGLSTTLFDRLLGADHSSDSKSADAKSDAKSSKSASKSQALKASAIGRDMMRMLTVQYRMHDTIMRWCSDELYDSKLTTTPDIAKHRLCDLSHVTTTDDTTVPFVMIDTAGCVDCEEDAKAEGESTSNRGEVGIVVTHVQALIASGVKPSEIGVITPYNAQVSLCRDELLEKYPGIEVSTADGFQGREKEAVVISMVRSNAKREVGFLSENRRMNVAITRAKRHVCIIGDSSTVSSHPFLSRLVAYAQECGEYRSASEYLVAGSFVVAAAAAATDAKSNASAATATGTATAAAPTAAATAAEKAELAAAAAVKAEQRAAAIAVAAAAKQKREAAIAATKAKSAAVVRDFKDTLLPASLDDTTIRTVLTDLIDRGHKSKYCANAKDAPPEPVPIASASAAGSAITPSTDTAASAALPFVDFPSALNSYQRRAVHEIADTLWPALSHESIGEGANRFIRCIRLSTEEQNRRRAERKAEAAAAADTAAAPPSAGDSKLAPVSTSKPAIPAMTEPDKHPASSGKKKNKNKKKAADGSSTASGGAVVVTAPVQIAGTSTSEEERKRLQRLEAINKRLGGSGGGMSAEEKRKRDADRAQEIANAEATAAVMAALDAKQKVIVASPDNKFAALDAGDDVTDTATAAAAAAGSPNLDTKHDTAAPATAATGTAAASSGKPKKAKKAKGGAAGAAGAAADDDIDALMAEFRVDKCKHPKCDASIKFTGFTCEFCREMYCVSHMNPIFHGCAESHRDKARADLAKRAHDLKLRTASNGSSDTPAKKLSSSDKLYLATKLHKATDRKASETVGKKAAKKAADKKKK